MLFIVFMFFLILSVILAAVNRDKKAWYMMALCATFLLMFSGIIIYFAKIGGLTAEQRRFFFLDNGVQRAVSFLNISLPRLGYLIAVGRFIFPLTLLFLAWEYNTKASGAAYRKYRPLACLLPVFSLALYCPPVFYRAFPSNSGNQKFLIFFTLGWIFLYVLAAAALLLQEYFCATIRFSKKMFRKIILFLLSISLVYLAWAVQDPVQVYQMYSIQYSSFFATTYFSLVSNVRLWYAITLLSVAAIAAGVWNIRKYGKLKADEKRGELKLEKKIGYAYAAVPVFVHSIKNQILAERVLQKRLAAELGKELLDRDALKGLLGQLGAMNQGMLERMEELYGSVQKRYIYLTPISPEEILETADGRFRQKYPEGSVRYQCQRGHLVLADREYLGEAVGNLLTNAYEAAVPGRPAEIRCTVKAEKLYLLIHIKDNGRGISKEQCKKIFEPFYTSKNTNMNWGMGLAYVRQTVKEHLGMIQVESRPGEGSDFYIYLPLYKGQKAKETEEAAV